LMPSQHGIHTWLDDSKVEEWPDNWNAIQEFDTLPECLAHAGYDTALIGKYHLGIADEPQNGFNEWVTLQIGHVLSFYENDMIDNGNRYTHPGHSVDFFTEKAVDYIDRRAAAPDEPFFLFLTYPAPYGHWPSIQGDPTNRFADMYRGVPMHSVPREGVSKNLIDWMFMRHDKMPGDESEFYRDVARIPNDLPTLRNYYSQMSMVDDGVGQILGALEQANLSDETLVIYTSDHGMSLGQHGFWGHGEDTWPSNSHREAHHIPLLIKPPGNNGAGSVESSLVGTTDIFATALDYAALPLPSLNTSPSRSLKPLLQENADGWNNTVFMEQEETRSIRTDRWLLMQRFEPTPYNFTPELYDLRSDPDERKNVADSPASRAFLDELSEQLNRFFAQYSDPKWDLWRGGTVKSNSTRPFLWREVWGEDWTPDY
ncbi:MAG: sulfatase family protein, partial [Hyphomicrobiaceae bacterium]